MYDNNISREHEYRVSVENVIQHGISSYQH